MSEGMLPGQPNNMPLALYGRKPGRDDLAT